MADKRKKSLVSCFLWHVPGSLLLFAAVIIVSNYMISMGWKPWIIAKQMVVCLMFSVIFAACKCLCRHVKEKRKQNSSQKSKATVYDADYHRMRESQTHLSRDHETSKKTIANLREENKKLKKQGRDKDLSLAQMTKRHADFKRDQEEKLKHINQEKAKAILKRDKEIQELKNRLNEANNCSSSLNEQLIQTQQQSDAHADRNQKLESQICDKDLELSQQQENIEAYKNEVASLKDKLAKRNEAIGSLEDHLSAKDLELGQLDEELTASKNKVVSLEETLNEKEQEIRQHEEALRTAIEHVFMSMDGLSAMCNATCKIIVYLNNLVHHLKCLPPPQLVVSSAPVFQSNNGYSLEGNDVCELSDKDDGGEPFIPPDHYNSQYTHHALVTNSLSIDEWNYYSYIAMEATSYCSQVSTDVPPMEFIPFSLEFSKYHYRLVVSPLFPPFPPPAPLIELHLIPT